MLCGSEMEKSMVQVCPKCGIVNPPNAERCDCGYDFVSGTQKKPIDPSYREAELKKRRLGYTLGIVGFLIMSFRGFMSTMDPTPDGRLLNTAPHWGFDIFLPIGIVGIISCAIALIRTK
jgi:hypothetical protein